MYAVCRCQTVVLWVICCLLQAISRHVFHDESPLICLQVTGINVAGNGSS
jgi:hypothetical protein